MIDASVNHFFNDRFKLIWYNIHIRGGMMCGRYYIEFNELLVARSIKRKLESKGLNHYATQEVFPTSNIITLVKNASQVDVDIMKWGIDLNGKHLINARSETLDIKPFYKEMKGNRCLVIANGFYEWKDKQKYYIHLKDEEYMYLAGIVNHKKELLIVTAQAECEMANIHHRTPIIYRHHEVRAFLNGTIPYRTMNDNLVIQNLNSYETIALDF